MIQLLRLGRTRPALPWDNYDPVREELFSVERLEEHARSLAAAQPVTWRAASGDPLGDRLTENGAVLLDAYRGLVAAINAGQAVTPAAEWLLDNYHLVEKQTREIRSDLPKGYYKQLPKLADGPFAGYPRVFGMAWAFVAHTDSRFDPKMLQRYVRAYQDVQPLTIGELWAMSITLRIVLIENLRRLAQQITRNRTARHEADALCDRLLGTGGRAVEPVPAVLAELGEAPLPDAFAVQLVHRLRDQDPGVMPVLAWLDQRLEAQGTTADAVVRNQHRTQGTANVTVRNIITGLRLIADVDWNEAFESVSLVDGVLAVGCDFRDMDFPTRNLYRTAIERLARGSDYAELDIARAAVVAAARAPADPDGRQTDPGYHLIAGGLPAFEARIGFRMPWRDWPVRVNRAWGIGGYAAVIVTAALAILAVALGATGLGGWSLAVLAAAGVIPALDLAIALVNRAVTSGFGAKVLPALELRDGIPPHLRTLVAVPILLTTPEEIAKHVEQLEVHFLASPEGDLHYALLSDWTDAAAEHAEGDEALVAAAAHGITRLNQRYGSAPGGARFLLLHRRRVWSGSEQRWMGWERKRGKLHELNRLLRGASDTTFQEATIPAGVRYVLTLDADTLLPRDTVSRLVGKMAHPLNQPRFDHGAGRVVEGYSVLQPRVTPSLPDGREGSMFQRIFSSLSGIDPYALAVSDVYQDLFGEGSYNGKGIYDVDAFEAALAGRVPDGALLSHDLFEGVFARAGLASDVEVVEDFPSRYDVGAMRHHRWARGDWQLLPWIIGRGPGVASGTWSAIPAIGRWKMLDNLRRTLSAPAAVLALLVGWAMPLNVGLAWTAFVISTIALPTLVPVVAAIPPSRAGVSIRSHLRALKHDLRTALALSALLVTFLGHQAWLMGDAVGRTLWRVFVTRRQMLEWITAAQATNGRRLSLGGFCRRMAGAFVIASAAFLVAGSGHGTWLLAAPFAVLWIVSPAVARWVSQLPRIARTPVAQADVRSLRLTARRTWRFFETFVTAADHMLPPDNFQEDPAPVLAHRTSPTNIGLYLLSVASARDFGWIGTDGAARRLEATLATLASMERCRGHFYNWYDTRTLRPLDPKYVSSVDSGNLAGHLIALANACREWQTTAPEVGARLAGVRDAFELTREAARMPGGHALDDVFAQLKSTLDVEDAQLKPRLAELAGQAGRLVGLARGLADDPGGADLLFWAEATLASIEAHRHDSKPDAALLLRLAGLEGIARSMALVMEFGFLLDPQRKLLSIGYLVAEGTLDPSCYDLLASEARLASFLAIAKGDIPARHWFRLGRTVTPVAHSAALISWSGSMFEYLMPSLVMRAPAGSLLEQTNRLAVRGQMDYAASRRLPWGISESAYNARDLELTYQYSNFGVPGLGLKRGLSENFVIAPYATALAAMVDPHASVANLSRLTEAGARGRYGFYEALDYTLSRVPKDQAVAVVRAYMAHHQGMTIVAIADAVFDARMRSRFHAEPMVRATELLLHERMPRIVSVARPWAAEVRTAETLPDAGPPGGRRFASAHQATPASHLLSNGEYAVMLTAAGSGYSRWGDFAVTRWREDATCDDHGAYVFLRDVDHGMVWTAGFQPSGAEPVSYDVLFNEDRAEFTRHDGTLITTMEVIVSAENDSEVRRVSVCNNGSHVREIEITSYAELALAHQAADVAHPAFSKLFVETEYHAGCGAILATRRKRTPAEAGIWAAHLAVMEGNTVGDPQFETDRARFLGRGHLIGKAAAIIDGRALSGTVGTVLDPVFALRQVIRVPPGAIVRIAFWTMVASTREALLHSVDKHRDPTAFTRAATLAWTQAQVKMHHYSITAGQAGLFQRLAGHVVHATPAMRAPSGAIRRGMGAQSGLWGQGISGDLPIVLLRIGDAEYMDIVHELLQAHGHWRMKRLAVDLVILNDRQSSYVQDLQAAIETQVRTRRTLGDGPQGQVFVLRADLVPPETLALLASVARVVLYAQRGSLSDQLDRREARVPPQRPQRRQFRETGVAPPTPALEFFNGLGGFAKDGTEYVTVLGPGQSTPAPWINVIANPAFGFQVSADGSGSTWSINSRENQLTPWSNDPVADRPGEAFYLHDDDTGELWGPTALPIRTAGATYVARHGRGYSRFEHLARGIAADLTQFVPMDAPVKISRLVLRNQSGRTRHLSVTGYVEWVLGPSRPATLPFVMTEMDPVTAAMLVCNPWSGAFGSRVAFLALRGDLADWTGDRREFIGRNGTIADPAALAGVAPLASRAGAGLDPCSAMRTRVELAPGASAEIVFMLGQADSADEARDLVQRYRAADLDAVQAAVTAHWDNVLGQVQVRTPDRSMDIMLNGWLLYQTLVCRVWARAGFYQASGAYGFRDQLQDGMALVASRPGLTREHLLRAAARQFPEGDVQHWWLPHSGQGVRTRISDDRAWLATAAAHYVAATGDHAVLDEPIAFLEGPALEAGEHDRFLLPTVSDEVASLFEHCARALDHSLALGVHGLPLMGTGDWNDGMNRVGEHGKGESVWLGWFLHAALLAFTPLAEGRDEAVRAAAWRAHAGKLQESLEREAWDGEWYRRGFYDDGTPLGSAACEECRIDSIAQSWAVLSGAGNPERAELAMTAAERELIRPGDGLALLFAPPFDRTPLDPGYVKGYPPGLRENGGQYTHAALWSVMAFAMMGEGGKATGLFSLLNPINHARTGADAYRYKVEPYVVAADIYSAPAHLGRGGWTWYTGSAGWMQRAGVESILGVRVRDGVLHFDPCIPGTWPGFELSFRHGSARYEVRVENPEGVERGIAFASLDGMVLTGRPLQMGLADDGATHRLQVRLGPPTATREGQSDPGELNRPSTQSADAPAPILAH